MRPHFPGLSESRATLVSKLLGEWIGGGRGGAATGLAWWGGPHHHHETPLPSPALGYGLLCLGMAYVSSMLGPVLQVGTGPQDPWLWHPKWGEGPPTLVPPGARGWC